MRRITARTLVIPAVFLAASLLITGCSAAGGGGSYDGGGNTGAEAPQVPSEESGGETVTDGDLADDPRDLVVTGYMTVTAEAPLDAADEVVALVESAGGRVDGRTERAPIDGDAGNASLVLRIPAERLTRTLDEIGELGRVDELDTEAVDVTNQHKDLEARISSLRASIATLEGFMARADKIEDLITLEQAIGSRRSELESLEAQLRGMEDQIAMSTITLTLRSEAEAPPVVPATFWSGLTTGWNGFVGFWSGFLVVLGVLLPWLVTAGIITVAVIAFVRWNRRRAASRPQPPSAPPGPPAPEAVLAGPDPAS